MNDFPHLSDEDLDALLLAQVKDLWQKGAMVVAKAMESYDSWDEDRIGKRIRAFAESGKIESQGDIRDWRHSEIRLKQVGNAAYPEV